MVAECLGKLTLVDPETLLPKLTENLKSESTFVRSTVVSALKYTISDQPQPIDTLLHSCIGDFLSTIGDPDLVRREPVMARTVYIDRRNVSAKNLAVHDVCSLLGGHLGKMH